MLCPYCGEELEEGVLRSAGKVFFLPDGKKVPLYTDRCMEKANAVPLPPFPYDVSLRPEWPKAYCCRRCHKLIMDY